jgi:hypothetical protein
LIAQGLAKMIKLAQLDDLITVLVPHLIDKGVVILQYADVTILLVQDDMDQIIHLKLILYMFEAMSRLKINFHKNEVMMVLHMLSKSHLRIRPSTIVDPKGNGELIGRST